MTLLEFFLCFGYTQSGRLSSAGKHVCIALFKFLIQFFLTPIRGFFGSLRKLHRERNPLLQDDLLVEHVDCVRHRNTQGVQHLFSLFLDIGLYTSIEIRSFVHI